MRLIDKLSFTILLFSSVNIFAQPAAAPAELDPDLSPALQAKYQALYDGATANKTSQGWIVGQRQELLMDPLNLRVHKILRKSPLSVKFLPEAMEQTRQFIWDSNVGHMQTGTLAIPGDHGQAQDLYELGQQVASVLPFSKQARDEMQLFALPGEVNAYTWSGLVGSI